MSRYIDRDKIQFFVGIDAETGEEIMLATMNQIEELPTADVVEVVRCKDCKFYKDWGDCITCEYWTTYEDVSTEPNAFCSYGERREQNEG